MPVLLWNRCDRELAAVLLHKVQDKLLVVVLHKVQGKLLAAAVLLYKVQDAVLPTQILLPRKVEVMAAADDANQSNSRSWAIAPVQ